MAGVTCEYADLKHFLLNSVITVPIQTLGEVSPGIINSLYGLLNKQDPFTIVLWAGKRLMQWFPNFSGDGCALLRELQHAGGHVGQPHPSTASSAFICS